MRFLIRRLDQLLRWLTGVFEYWDDPECMFRARLTRAPRPLSVPRGWSCILGTNTCPGSHRRA
jgi:hypothetical protein